MKTKKINLWCEAVLLLSLILISGCSKDAKEEMTSPEANLVATLSTNANYEVVNTSTIKMSGFVSFTSGKFTGHGHVWSATNTLPTVADQTIDLGALSQSGAFTSELKNLEYGVSYFVRSYGRNGEKIVYGETVKVTTGWDPGAAFGGGRRRDGAACAVGAKIFIGLGAANLIAPASQTDWWEYDTQADKWAMKAAFPGAAREEPFSFVISGMCYVGGGIAFSQSSSASFSRLTDFWRYDPATDQWTSLTPAGEFPLGKGSDVTNGSFSIAGIGYVISSDRLFAYDPVTNTWSHKGDLPTTGHEYFTACAVNGKGYLIAGENAAADFLEYDPVANTWKSLGAFPGASPRYEAVAVALKGKIYVGTGTTDSFFAKPQADLWEYTIATKTWRQLASMLTERQGAFAVATEERAYVGMGAKANTLDDWWRLVERN
ncbi:MAG: hypothetical protein H6555_09465 [Lewinellaceae bacterium]|nr:hypothetical protein [Lewinellaceae bacterium]